MNGKAKILLVDSCYEKEGNNKKNNTGKNSQHKCPGSNQAFR